MIGSRLAHYEITGHLGSGGMGEVYRATDTVLGRDVAIKVLPGAVAQDPDRLARFEREARTLAALNHANIAQIHGLEKSDGVSALVMELVEGPTLADVIVGGSTDPPLPVPRSPHDRRGGSVDPLGAALPLAEALRIACQIASALEAAHDQGIVHRDLKPANIKVKADGTVKVLDFGLAKAIGPPEGGPYGRDDRGVRLQPDLTASPTMASPAMTRAGIILGTAAYMSPEQAKGREADRRSDVFAFGCVLYEMLTGRPAFEGADLTEIMGRVVTAEPDWARLPSGTPRSIHRVLRRALEKDSRQRLGDIRDARLDIEEAQGEPALVPAGPAPRTSKVWPVSLAVATGLIALLAIPSVSHLSEVAPPAPVEMRVEITTPTTTDRASLAISPDGRKIVFVATSAGRPTLWLRALDSTTARTLPGTDGASLPFWSPDSRSVGFFADAKLKRVEIDGSSPQVLASASYGFGGSWNSDGVILYNPVPGRPILRVSDKGGRSTSVTRIEQSQETGHRQPHFLPDGRHFLYSAFVGGDIHVGRIDGEGTKRLVERADGPMYVPPGFLLFVRQGTLFAQRFDADRLELSGVPFPVAERVATQDFISAVAASGAGTIAYRSASASDRSQFVWFDRTGHEIGRVGSGPDTAEMVTMPSMSLDGASMMVMRSVNANADLWFLDVARGVASRFTSDPANDVFPVRSPDGALVVFASTRKGGVHNLYRKAAGGAGAEESLLETSEDKMPTDWSPDGRHVMYATFDPKTQNDIWALPVEGAVTGAGKPFPVVQTEFEERNGQFSPDGKWIAYQSNESGRFEIYVQPFPGPGPKTRISVDGGAQARWRRDGRELFYKALDGRLMAVPIRLPAAGQTIEASAPLPLFLTHSPKAVENIDGPQYVVSPDGRRFLVNTVLEEGSVAPITLIVNWKPPVN